MMKSHNSRLRLATIVLSVLLVALLSFAAAEYTEVLQVGTFTAASIAATTADIDGGTIDDAVIGGSTPAAITGTTVSGTTVTDGTASLTGGTASGIVDLGTVGTADIDGGTIDGTVIGASSEAAITATTVTITANDTLLLSGDATVWDDLRVPMTAGKVGLTRPPAFTQWKDNGSGSPGIFAFFFEDQAAAGNEEEIFFSAQLPHSYLEGSDIEFHIHWTPAVSGGLNEYVKWGLEYIWVDMDEASAANATIITSNAATGATATTSGDTTLLAGKHYVTDLGDIAGSGMKISSMVMCRIFRNSSHADDDLAQDAVALECDFHFEIDRMGSRTEDAK